MFRVLIDEYFALEDVSKVIYVLNGEGDSFIEFDDDWFLMYMFECNFAIDLLDCVQEMVVYELFFSGFNHLIKQFIVSIAFHF